MKGNCGECHLRWACDIDPDKCNVWPDTAPMTNADRIRSMTDEELANIIECPYGNPYFDEHLPCKGSCHDCLLIWLQQPAGEEDKHETD